jgi:hypothetical protein
LNKNNVLFLFLPFLFQDTATLGIVVVKQCGYTATVKVVGPPRASVDGKSNLSKIDQPDGGTHALNINRYVELLLYMVPNAISVRLILVLQLHL